MKRLSPMLLLLTVSFFSLNKACRKASEPKLPDATQIGANTAGCLLNGQLWIASSDNCFRFGTPYTKIGYYSYDKSKNSLFINFQRCTKYDGDQWFSISIQDFFGPGTYACNKKSYIPGIPGSSGKSYNFINYYIAKNTNEQNYETSELATGSVTITKIDTSRTPVFTHVSGVFECKLKNLNNMYDSLVITSGRFDIPFN